MVSEMVPVRGLRFKPVTFKRVERSSCWLVLHWAARDISCTAIDTVMLSIAMHITGREEIGKLLRM